MANKWKKARTARHERKWGKPPAPETAPQAVSQQQVTTEYLERWETDRVNGITGSYAGQSIFG